jgi:hypothetical protein
MESLTRIITAKDYSEREGAGGSVKARILKMREKYHKQKNISLIVNGIDAPSGAAVRARIWQGQWIADCECGGAEFVEPTEPLFFCFSCGNRANGNTVRPVEFPAEYKEIEAVVLTRPVDDMRGLTNLERAGLARAQVVVDVDGEQFPLIRSWNPDESLQELMEQNKVLDGLVMEKGKVMVVTAPSVLRTSPPNSESTNLGESNVSEVNNGI